MKNLAILIVILSFINTSCNTIKNTGSKETIAVIDKWINAYNMHDISALKRLYTAEALIASPDFEGFRKVDVALTKTFADYFASAPELKAVLNRYVVNENEIAISYSCQGTIKNIDQGEPMLNQVKNDVMIGKRINIEVFVFFKLKNGKIIEEKSMYNGLAFMKQVGLMK
jgi:steroid delta-isomerase-like uncharacterized protein